MFTEDSIVTANERLGARFGLLTLSVRDMARDFKPGQFVQMEVPGRPDLVLRRPMSPLSFRTDGAKASMDVLYLVAGAGTRHVASLEQGTLVNILGPLGNGFPLPNEGDSVVMLAGGTGLGPVYLLAEALGRRENAALYYGARNGDELFHREAINHLGVDVVLCTDDGSAGVRGLVTDAARERIEAVRPVLYACGPRGMLAAVQSLASEFGLRAWVSLEERMGCGVGACLSCPVPLKGGGYRMVCSDGPVFDGSEVVLADG